MTFYGAKGENIVKKCHLVIRCKPKKGLSQCDVPLMTYNLKVSRIILKMPYKLYEVINIL